MNSQSQIIQMQNSPEMLKCQFAAHKCYNKGELQNYISWILSIAGAILIFLPFIGENYFILIPVIVDVLTIFFRKMAKTNIRLGADLRNYFDDIVLGFNNPTFTVEVVNTLWEKVNIIEARNSKKCQNAIKSTDQAEVPGMKDWYSFPKNCHTNEQAVFECQHQNYWWTDKEYRTRKKIYIFLTAVVIGALFIGFFLNLVKTIACLFGIIVNLYDDIRESKKCNDIMQSIKTIINIRNIENNAELIQELQSYIERRRELLITEIDFIHRKNAKDWANLYNSIFNSQRN